MKPQSWQNHAATRLFALTVALFFAFFIYMYMNSAEQVSVYQPENHHRYNVTTDLELELAADASAPAGVRKIYRGVLSPQYSPESCLCFNISHHNIQVWFGDTLVYSLAGAETNRLARNVGSNWCSVHVGQEHAGQPVTVILTPLFEAAIEKNPTFLLGSHYAIAIDLLRSELPQLVLSAICTVLGILVVAVALYFRYIVRTETNAMAYLGLFSMSLGMWKLTDLPSTPLLFPEKSIALGYICIGALFLTALCLLLYFSTLFEDQGRKALWILACGECLVCLAILAMQVLGITELRQNLVYSHILLIGSIGAIPAVALCNRIIHKQFGLKPYWRLLLLLLAGIFLDLGLYYRNRDNATISFSVLGLVIYTLVVFVGNVQRATRKANTDNLTGLENRTRWNDLMHGSISLPEPFGILMLDLNGLKWVNDTLGHEAGDQLIFRFSNILRNTLPHSSVICRWGGDEFAVILDAASREALDQQTELLRAAVEAYNTGHSELPIHYAVGSALSAEHPGASRIELFRLADEAMYRDKQQWYAQK